jgi:hypothetical protein
MNDASSFVQAIRGPIMLITLGALVAIDYAGIYGFWRTWPILIIVFGVLKLLERGGGRPAPPPYGGNFPGPYSGQYPAGQYPQTPAGSGPAANPPPGGNAI